MNKTLFSCIAAILISGCASVEDEPKELTDFTERDAIEFNATAAVPLNLAYQNVLAKARQCWQPVYSGQIDGKLFEPAAGQARVSFSIPGRMVGSQFALASIDLYADSASTTRLVGRSFASTGDWNLARLDAWAAGTDSACVQTPVSAKR